MTSIAPDVVSYEHEAPLAYVGQASFPYDPATGKAATDLRP
jgi:hypothetical protein